MFRICALGTLKKYCACQRKYRRTAPAKKNPPVAIFLQAGARSSFGSPVELQPGVHAFSGEPCGWCSTAQDALLPVQAGSDGANSIMDASRNRMLPRWHQWMLA